MGEPKKVLAAVADLFFTAKIQALVRRRGAKLTVVKSFLDLAALEKKTFDVLVIDLEEKKQFDSLVMLKEMRDRWPGVACWAFSAHEHGELMGKARRMGCDTVLARGPFEVRFSEFLEVSGGV